MCAATQNAPQILREHPNAGAFAAFDIEDGVGWLPRQQAQRVHRDRPWWPWHLDAGPRIFVVQSSFERQRRKGGWDLRLRAHETSNYRIACRVGHFCLSLHLGEFSTCRRRWDSGCSQGFVTKTTICMLHYNTIVIRNRSTYFSSLQIPVTVGPARIHLGVLCSVQS